MVLRVSGLYVSDLIGGCGDGVGLSCAGGGGDVWRGDIDVLGGDCVAADGRCNSFAAGGDCVLDRGVDGCPAFVAPVGGF